MSQSGIDTEWTADGRSTSNASSASSLGIIPFGFHAKTSYDANDALQKFRSEKFAIKESPRDDDVWKRPPPDLRYVSFDPSPPKRNTRDAMKPWLYGTIPGKKTVVKRSKDSSLPHILREKNKDAKNFDTLFRVMRPFTAKKQFVTKGMNPAGTYSNPKPHDFRGYPPIKKLGLPEFRSDEDHDPFNIKFKTERLNMLHGETKGPPERDLVDAPQMAPPKSPNLSWESRLILEKNEWPDRFAGYTRFRLRNRNPYSAFIERAGDQLQREWARERLTKSLEQCT